jgi:hypothetical protein
MGEAIDGYGFALACDFLKESGFPEYCKPDVHLMEIFHGVGLVKNNFSPVTTFVKVVEMARAVDENPATVDKLFWIVGSGKFEAYNKTHTDTISVKRLKDGFVKQYNEKYK